ncbi:hypothetical protein [Erythrobacter aureus]|uniref:Uncharacterized protein n=1 Tax=Erythrobacter aureus TaxID=2182384 RepID=A0A345YJ28_9SPHN|nr:hypothetical protein [Erythrobacter aureus]AXK43930.1 hypothetical protein DVR09_15865 [Erythrobacter aureus]
MTISNIDQLRSELNRAEERSEREASDLRHSNPGRLRRAERERHDAARRAKKLHAALDVGERLDLAGLSWVIADDSVYFLLEDGSKYPAATGDALEAQIAILHRPGTAGEKRDKLRLNSLNVDASREFKWIRARLAGISTPKFRKDFLLPAGLIDMSNDYPALTDLARDHELLAEHDGQHGPWFTASALCTAWIYRCYLAGRIPFSRSYHGAPEPQIELEAIAAAHEDALASLPQPLRDLMEAP